MRGLFALLAQSLVLLRRGFQHPLKGFLEAILVGIMHDKPPNDLLEFSSPLAREADELALIVKDLETALACFEAFCKEDCLAPGPYQYAREIRLSLYRNAVITMCACFDSSTHNNLDSEEVFAAIPGAIDVFSWLLKQRNSWIAHRYGPLRQVLSGYIIDPETGGIEGHGYVPIEYLGPKSEDMSGILTLTKTALDHAGKRFDEVRERCMAEVKALTPNQRKSLPKAIQIIASPAEFQMGRKKHRNISRERHRKSDKLNE